MGKRNTSLVMAGLTLGGLLLMGSPAGAQTYYHPPIDQRDYYQQRRIQQGIDSGALSPGEARYLEREQGRIQAAEERMRADGRLSPWERQRLRQMQNQASRDIYRLEHNGRTAEGWGNGNHYGWGNGNHNGWGEHTNSGWNGHRYADWDGRRPYDPRYDHRGGHQQHRFQQGIHHGASGPGGAPYSRNQAGWQGSNNSWNGRGNGWQGHNSGNYGTTPGGAPVTGAISTGTAAPGTTQGWQGPRSGRNGYTPGNTAHGTATMPGGTNAARNTQGWRGNPARTGQPGAFRQPAPQARNFGQPGPGQGQPSFQQARPQFPQNMMRPNGNSMPRQPGGFAGKANRANFSLRRR